MPSSRWALADSVTAVSAAQWDALESQGVPFVRHHFLAALERTGAVGGQTGWRPRPLLLWEGETLVGAVPLYEKDHSYGEFVFDFAWAEAYARHGLAYYPKLVAATPFTPATGPRLLVRPGAAASARRAHLVAALRQLGDDGRWSSVHVQFAEAAEVEALAADGFLSRLDCQFLWQNHNFQTFDDFLATFTADKRKKLKRERRRIDEAGIRHEWRAGHTLDADDWQVVHALLATTFHRHGHSPYLPPAFFVDVSRDPATAPHVVLARRDGEGVLAAALFFRGRDTLYGRYWGCVEAWHSLHFETCYHQGIDYCIREGLQRFEPGTQGEHKIARGFAPTYTHSAHHLADARFAEALAPYLSEERDAIRRYHADASTHTPFRRELPPVEAP